MSRPPLPHNDSRRLFYALWPDEACRAALSSLQQDAGLTGRLVPRANLHLTLAFLGSQDASRLPDFQEILEAVPRHSFEITLNKSGWFAKPQVAWLGMDSVPSELARLQSDLTERLVALNISFDSSRSFRPHVTLARNVSGPPARLGAPISWAVKEIALVESKPIPGGVQYRVLSSVALGEQL